VRWEGGVVARLVPGPSVLEPGVKMARNDLLSPSAVQRVQRRVTAFVRDWVAGVVAPLHTPDAEALRGPAQGLLYALQQGLGVVLAHEVGDLVRQLQGRDRAMLARLGVRLGVEHVWAQPMLAGARDHAILWRVAHGPDRTSGYHRVVGTPLVGGVPVRVDVLEAFAARAREGARHGAFAAPEGFLTEGDVPAVLEGLGYTRAGDRWARGRRR
jgi:hypothetical protein